MMFFLLHQLIVSDFLNVLTGAGYNAGTMASGENRSSNDNCCHLQVIGQASDEDPAFMKSSKHAIDLIGTFDNHGICTYIPGSNISANNKVDSPPPLELSLRRYPSGSVNQFPDEKHKLNHSDASAFTR